MTDKSILPEDILLRYVTGVASLEEMARVTLEMKRNPETKRLVELMERMHKDGLLVEYDDPLPALSMAAVSDDNLCDVICEHYILKDYLEKEDELLVFSSEAEKNSWHKESGTPLHHMGRILEKHGMQVTRSYGHTLRDLCEELSKKNRIIAVVDYGRLRENCSDGVFHAMVCLSISSGYVRVYDPALGEEHNYSEDCFVNAWAESQSYLVIAAPKGLKYNPHPIDVDDIDLDEDLLELSEAIAENAHEVWARERMDSGWAFGETRDDTKKLHPDLVPYSDLEETEKNVDRQMSLKTIKLVKKLGFQISRRYTRYCQHCGDFVSDTMRYCPHCGGKLLDD